MRLIVVQSGKLRDAHCIAMRDEYAKRFSRFGKLDLREQQPRAERSLWPKCDFRVLVDERGTSYTSPAFAAALEQWTMRHGTVAFCIGAAHGHDAATAAEADSSWSLGSLVLPHQLAHVIVVEQLYRAATILAGIDYHH